LAGGLSQYAEENNIIVLRGGEGAQKAISVRYADIKEGDALSTNTLLQSGDVIVIP
jgi:polysaccharide export outer membrane protein